MTTSRRQTHKLGDRRVQQTQERRPWRTVLIMLVLLAAVLTLFIVWRLIRSVGSASEIRVSVLPCTASSDVTPFGDNVLTYDGRSIHCLSTGGGIRWSVPVGSGAHFSCSDSQVVAWTDNQVFIFDRSGHTTYNETFREQIQFARIGSRYCAVVKGGDTTPTLLVKNLDGTAVDEETDGYSGMLLLDMGFYGEADRYLWTMAIDVYSTAINTVMNTFEVGRMNTGAVNLGKFLAYKVLYENGRLRCFTTQQMYTYDYKAVQDLSASRLVYGWRMIDSYVPERGNGVMLMAREPTDESATTLIQELRVLTGSTDRRYTVPSACVGAGIRGRYIYAISRDYCYRADMDAGRFTGFSIPLPQGQSVTELLGLTTSCAIVASGDSVYSVTLPR